ncbi:Hypothetical protein GSB_153943 [Giardia duodenalis]|uniref:Kelch motif-containing protein n=2 Tax=Giardia intestinalis TaxID=5741 RepID=C6LQS6_GIAIB|nr:Hypothetical protein GL50581_1106 [Giardia intestinalis ATCC 50581]ESU43023.1 Hypothetical protein GSB_153943 [Giardia intestinalis]
MEPVPYSLIRTHENVLTESQGKMFSIDHRIFITTMRNEIYYTLVGELRFVLYARAPLLQSRILAACACNGKIAIIHGGYNRKERKVLGDILMFSGNVLQTIAAPCLPRREHAITLLSDTHLLIFGGRTILTNVSDDIQIVNLHDGTVIDLSDAGMKRPSKRYGHAMSVANDRVFLYGGTNGKKSFSDLWEFVYDRHNPSDAYWTSVIITPSHEWFLPKLNGIYNHTILPYDSLLIVISGIGNYAGCFYVIDISKGIIAHSTTRFPINSIAALACIYQDFIVTPSFCINVIDVVSSCCSLGITRTRPLGSMEKQNMSSYPSSESLRLLDLQ